MKRGAFFLILLTLSFCQIYNQGTRVYVVKAGKHYAEPCKPPELFLFKHSLQFEFQINNTWIFSYPGGWSKVYGLSQGMNHLNNSCRLAYKYQNGLMVFGMYVYKDGKRNAFAIDTLQMGRYYCDIGHSSGNWHLTLNGKTHVAPAGEKFDQGYICRPYIGGAETISSPWVVVIWSY
jgi:hypothetical protein